MKEKEFIVPNFSPSKVKEIVQSQLDIRLEDEDLLWTIVDVMYATNEILMKQFVFSIEQAMNNATGKAQSLLIKENEALINQSVAYLCKAMEETGQNALKRPIEEATNSISKQNKVNGILYQNILQTNSIPLPQAAWTTWFFRILNLLVMAMIFLLLLIR